MTITLAAVYAPIGFQGGLTGALFREFAFTLAGAVFISGIVALTLSPMMSSKLLTRRAPAAGSRARSIALRRHEARLRAGARRDAAHAAGRLRVWVVLSLAGVPMYMFSPSELAPNEDQGVVFGAIDVPANATLEQLDPYTEQINSIFKAAPEFDHSFQITFPTGGFGGMLVKPWDERKRSIFPIQEELIGKLPAWPASARPCSCPPRCRAPALPGRVRDRVDREPRRVLRFAEQIVGGGEERPVRFPAHHRREDRSGQDRAGHRSRQGRLDGADMQQVGADLSSMLGGNFVNRFNIDGRSYKVIPQIERNGRLTPDSSRIYVTGPRGKWCRSARSPR